MTRPAGSVHAPRDFTRVRDLWKPGELDPDGLITDRIRLDDAAALKTPEVGKDIARRVNLFG